MAAHFETLWEEAEALTQTETSISSFKELTKEFIAKAEVFIRVSERLIELNVDDKHSKVLETSTFGEVLFMLAQLSAKRNIDTFQALHDKVEEVKIQQLVQKYSI